MAQKGNLVGANLSRIIADAQELEFLYQDDEITQTLNELRRIQAIEVADKIGNIAENLEYYKKIINSAIDKRLITLEHPIRTLINLQNGRN